MNLAFARTRLFRKLLPMLAGLAPLAASAVDLPTWPEFVAVKDQGRVIWQVDIDNDSLLLKKDDGFYTSGNRLGQRYVQETGLQSISYGWRLGQDLYTASDIKVPPARLAANDHPYAGWLYAGVFSEHADVNGKASLVGLDLGCLGPCAGGDWTQTHLHRLLQQPLPQAWASQLPNEWGVVLRAEYAPGRVLPLSGVDLTPRIKARFGNIFTDAALDLALRWPLGEQRLNALPDQPASYVVLRGEIKAVAYNATLQGGYFSHVAHAVTPRRLTGELELGYQWRNEQFGVYASVVRRSNEISGLPNSIGAQNFASLQFSYAM